MHLVRTREPGVAGYGLINGVLYVGTVIRLVSGFGAWFTCGSQEGSDTKDAVCASTIHLPGHMEAALQLTA